MNYVDPSGHFAISTILIGLAGTLGAGLGAAMIAGESLTVLGTTISGSAAMSIACLGSFGAGMAGYVTRVGIRKSESFDLSDMFIEGGINMASGMLSFAGGFCGGILGLKIPGKSNIINAIKFQIGSTYFGVSPMKILLSILKRKLEGLY